MAVRLSPGIIPTACYVPCLPGMRTHIPKRLQLLRSRPLPREGRRAEVLEFSGTKAILLASTTKLPPFRRALTCRFLVYECSSLLAKLPLPISSLHAGLLNLQERAPGGRPTGAAALSSELPPSSATARASVATPLLRTSASLRFPPLWPTCALVVICTGNAARSPPASAGATP